MNRYNMNPASFRDPSGFVFSGDGNLYRAIAPAYFEDLALLQISKLYDHLVSKGMLIPYTPVNQPGLLPAEYSEYKIIQPEKIPFISYPYEWSFSQLKSAALLTLSVHLEALRHGMSLKDASVFNVQFRGAQPVFIDTLSFERYTEGSPWIAYGQFCRHFLAPLSLMAYRSPALSKITQTFLDGIPLDLASTLLPKRSYLNSAILSHLHVHSKFQNTGSAQNSPATSKSGISKSKLITLLKHLKEGIEGIKLKTSKSTWIDYHEIDNYTGISKENKQRIIAEWIRKIKPYTVWDLGCNTGEFSFIAAQNAQSVISMDSDILCVDALYNKLSAKGLKNILPLFADLSNPSPALGWAGTERSTLPERGRPNLLMALALIHHLRIANNTPLAMIAKLFSDWSEWAIVEFIPKEDSQIQKMLSARKDIFDDMGRTGFEKAFGDYFEITESSPIPDSVRVLYLLKRKRA